MDIDTKLQSFLDAGDNIPHAYLFLTAGNFDHGYDVVQKFAEKIAGLPFPNVDSVLFDAADGTGVSGIREVLQLASLMPVSANKKVVVLKNMDSASPQILNSLLKTLEEPSDHAVFCLISSRPLLSTIMSRCQVINLPKSGLQAESSIELNQAMTLLEENRTSGLAERLALVNTLSELDDDLLPELIQTWMRKQTDELRTKPQNFKAVRITMETLQSLRGNFNKKMVLQNFVTNALV